MKIIFETLISVFRHENIDSEEARRLNITMKEFTGTLE